MQTFHTQIFGHPIRVFVSARPFEEVQVDDTHVDRTVGYFHPNTNEIGVFYNKDLPDNFGATLIHEYIEAVDNYCDLKLNHTQISTLASGIHQAMSNIRVGETILAETPLPPESTMMLEAA